MSNWRINFGVGPLRYVKRLDAKPKKTKQGFNPWGCLLAFVFVFGTIFVCCVLPAINSWE